MNIYNLPRGLVCVCVCDVCERVWLRVVVVLEDDNKKINDL